MQFIIEKRTAYSYLSIYWSPHLSLPECGHPCGHKEFVCHKKNQSLSPWLRKLTLLSLGQNYFWWFVSVRSYH